MPTSDGVPPSVRPDLVRRRFDGRLLNATTQKPLAGLIVQLLGLEPGVEPADLGYDITNKKGVFTIVYSLSPTSSRAKSRDPRRRFRIVVMDRRRQEIYRTDIRETAEPHRVTTVPVHLPAVPVPPSDSLKDVARKLRASNVTIPTSLLDELDRRGIRTLADLRAQGGVGHLEDLPTPPDDAVWMLDAHARLEALSPDFELNAALISRGFTSVGAIARAPRAKVVAAAHERVGHFKAAQIHVQARAETRFLNSVLMGLKADWANGFPVRIPKITNPHIPEWFRRTCDCKQCTAAVSPLSYLADLLDYTVHHVENGGADIDVQFLSDTFHQPFGDLPVSCASGDTQVRQVRICVEVLRRHLAHVGRELSREKQTAYCMAAYSDLLIRLGTSFQELRLSRTAATEEQRMLAERLGIDLFAGQEDRVAQLLLDPATIDEGDLERLFGLVDTRRGPLAEAGGPSRLETWRLDRLRAVWREQDRPTDQYTETIPAEARLAIVDPDLIGPDDFRYPVPKADAGQPNRPFDVWLRRRQWVVEQLTAFSTLVDQTGAPDLAAMLDRMYGSIDYFGTPVTPWSAQAPRVADFDTLLDTAFRRFTEEAQQAIARIERELFLSLESFARLVTLRNRDRAARNGIVSAAVTEPEWTEVHSILTQAAKGAAFTSAWIEEERVVDEQHPGVLLGARDFWISLREPLEGAWPPIRAGETRPWIDPDEVELNDLPEATAGARAIRFWNARQDQIRQNRSRLRSARQDADTTFDRLVEDEISQTRDQLSVLKNDLDSADPVAQDAARTAITTGLHLPIDTFTRLIELRTRNDHPDPARRLSGEEWEELYAILTRAAKERDWISVWNDEERNAALDGNYWLALKARLPRWRATAESRANWQQALRRRRAAPIIDPEVLVDTGRLADPFGGAAVERWQERTEWRNGRLAAVQARREADTPLAGLDRIVEDALGVPPDVLSAIDDESTRGVDITPRVQQLDLTLGAYQYVRRIRALAASGASVLDDEWKAVYSILVRAEKSRQFAEWRREERDSDLILGPDQFKLPEPAPHPLGPEPIAEDPGSSRLFDLRAWEDLLRARIEQKQAIIDGLHAARSAAEEATLLLLRDSLIEASVAGGRTTDGQAQWLTDRLLIDTRTDGCQMTTRVAQAIEALQGILWSLRTGQLHDTFPSLELRAEDFDVEWTWIGSYVTWRAAAFVFIYPENILIPSLRRWQTPAFRTLVDDLRSNRRLTPEQACQAAHGYYNYFADICSITLEASRVALTRVHRGAACQREPAGYRQLTYLFGRPAGKNIVYWCSHDFKDASGYAQTFWDMVPGLKNVERAVGAQPYDVAAQPDQPERFLFLFVRTQQGGQQKLMFSRYDLEAQAWDPEPQELELPPETTRFEADVVRTNAGRPPQLRIHADNGLFYERSLNGDGTGWADGDWQPTDRLWSPWTRLPAPDGFSMSSDAAITALAQGDRVHVFLVGSVDDGGRVYTTSSETPAAWSAWERVLNERFPQGATIAAIARDDTHLDLFSVRQSEVVWNARASGEDWPPWQRIGISIPQEGGLGNNLPPIEVPVSDTAVVTAVTLDAEHIHVFVAGENGLIHTNDWDADHNGWGDVWHPMLGTEFPTDTTVAAFPRGDERIAVLARDDLGRIRINSWAVSPPAGSWRTHVTRTGDLFPSPAVLTIAAQTRRLDLFMVDRDGAIQSNSSETLEDNDHWTGWVAVSDADRPTFVPGGAVTAVKTRNGHLHLFAVADDGVLHSSWCDADDQEWKPWVRVGRLAEATFAPGARVAVVKRRGRLHLLVPGTDGRIHQCRSEGWPDAAALTETLLEDYNNLKDLGLLPADYRVGPRVLEPLALTAPSSATRLQELRGTIAEVFGNNEQGPLSNLAYLEEAYYFVPIHIALALQAAGQYVAALDWFRLAYDYSIDSGDDPADDRRRISYVLARDAAANDDSFSRADDWLLDPLNPHGIATTRPGTYTRFTLMSLIRCFLDYADAEFTRDTAESLPRARVLYTTALELLDLPELNQQGDACQPLGERLDELGRGVDAPWMPAWNAIRNKLGELGARFDALIEAETIEEVEHDIGDHPETPLNERLRRAHERVQHELDRHPGSPSLATVLGAHADAVDKAYDTLLGYPGVAVGAGSARRIAGVDFLHSVSVVAGVASRTLAGEKIDIPWLGETMSHTVGGEDGPGLAPGGAEPPVWTEYEELTRFDPFAPTRMAALARMARTNPWDMLHLAQRNGNGWAPDPRIEFCIRSNPVLEALRLHAELNLYKLRTCRNIAGLEREVDPYAAATDTVSGLPMIGASGNLVLPGTISFQPTPYRYTALIERARQLVQMAAQIEAAMLSALERRDAESYTVLKARQDLGVAHAGVFLQELRIREAESGVTLAELQQERAEIQADQYRDWLEQGLLGWEQAALDLMAVSAGLHVGAAGAAFGPNVAGERLSSLAAAASTAASMLQTYAAYERQRQEWQFQRNLALHDVRIGVQQVKSAEDHVRVVGQERLIAKIQADHAQASVDFLANKFTNAELYDWMSGVLEGVYSFFLQQATAMAKLAENQLAFERQDVPPAVIQNDYWETPAEGVSSTGVGGRAADRRGLTGSARLLQDIFRLDQYAFDTDKRKLQLTKTVSLARLSPAEFQRCRETGVMSFTTPMELFDRDFPGHYLRLIKRVRTSVVALIPPTQGINATLSSTGTSRVVIGGDLFQTVVIRRAPETVALSSPRDATGLFELDQKPEMLLPFEGLGVDTSWTFSMPPAGNRFDFSTLADVLLTIEYTALSSFDYRQQVLQLLPARLTADRPFSFRHEFADAWYDLHNPDQTATPMLVRFSTTRRDFPPNLDELTIAHVVVYFSRSNGRSSEVPITLHFTEAGASGSMGGGATTVDGVISTRKSNAASWIAMIGKAPFGEWELALLDTLPDGRQARELFKNKEVDDILLVITYSGRAPRWP